MNPFYTHARDALGLRPAEFARALETLEIWGLVQLRVVPRKERPDDRRRVRLELTALGRVALRLHSAIDQEWRRIAAEEGLALDALASA